jgi:hypothetical protein
LTDGDDTQWVEKQWGQTQTKLHYQIAALNQRIRDYNLIIPTQTFFRSPIKKSSLLSASD